MIHYIKTVESGQIVCSGTIQKEAFQFVVGDGGERLRVVETPINPETHYWKNGLIPYPPKPDAFAVFDYTAGAWVLQADVEGAADEARAERRRLLSASDWTQAPDAPVDKDAWQAYRQALRDITDQDGFPFEIIWPTAPK